MAGMTDRTKKTETVIGLFLISANCFRIGFWPHTSPTWLRLSCDTVAILGFLAFIHGSTSPKKLG
jgi:hypothetical protein